MADEYNGFNGNGENGNGNGHKETKPLFTQKLESINQSMQIDRYFTQEGKNPFLFGINGNPINWISENVSVTDDRGKVIFTQPNIKRPDFWSPLAIKVVANKYFWGDQIKGERENNIEQLIGRVSRFIGRQAIKQGYFKEKESSILQDEISSICLNQLCVFNSPVWFNAGIHEYNIEAGGVSAYIWDEDSKKVIKSEKKMDRPQCAACFILSIF